ncbi:hypothetical protein B9G55_07935 [Saccharibacillus sp. O16]|nr:hypothetical protein B9G55_07935 [Saccharibacillus sp. O16]
MNRVKLAASVLGAAAAGFYTYIRLFEKRSFASWGVEKLMASMKKVPQTEEALTAYLDQRQQVSDLPYPNPQKLVRSQVEEIDVDGMQTFVWNHQHDRHQKVILYIHGGGYTDQPLSFQIKAVDRIARLTNAKIVLPIYPKTPRYTYKDAFPKMERLYAQVCQEMADPSSDLTLMGDSAGGGLALGLAYALRDRQMPQPKHIILLSPWMDLTLDHPEIAQREALDPMLAAYPLQKVGPYWADGPEGVRHPFVSPMFGNPTGLGRITLFSGTHEIFYPDILKFDQLLSDRDIEHTTIIGEKMNHVYPVFPIPEGRKAQQQIAEIING